MDFEPGDFVIHKDHQEDTPVEMTVLTVLGDRTLVVLNEDAGNIATVYAVWTCNIFKDKN